ncbi:MAG: arsenite methyltransferase [Chloroflexia bacterium]|nr:arsenite methyltransferase [Chloroflexia bacterium]
MSTEVQPLAPDALRENVREKYAERARQVAASPDCGCGPACCRTESGDPVTSGLYEADEIATVPGAAIESSLGCGNPTALADLHPGEVVLDLGSGGGIDVLLSARRVGATGFAYGLDMTDEMLALAERNKTEAGVTNVEFLKGHIEEIPLPENTADVVISNCVINLASDKGQVLREAFRVLKPGGRFAVSDVVAQGELPADLRRDMEAWVGCVAGALEEREYRRLLTDAGFTAVELQVTRVYDPRELAASIGTDGGCCGGNAPTWDDSAFARFEASGGRVVSAFVRARKP